MDLNQFSAIASEARISGKEIDFAGLLGVNNLLLEKGGIVRVYDDEIDSAWWKVISAVAYPVHKTAALYRNKGEIVRARGLSPQGRQKEFSFIVTDRDRTGEYQAIASVTGIYMSPMVYDIYLDMRDTMSGEGYQVRPVDLFVTGNGGAQTLILEITGLTSVDGMPDNVKMRVSVETSVDGTTSHSMTIMVHNLEGDVTSGVYGDGFDHVKRHTLRNYTDGKLDFAPVLETLVENWNSKIIPMMIFMNNQKFSKSLALQLIEKIGTQCKFPDEARERIASIYVGDELRSNAKEDSLYKVNAAFSQYFTDDLDDKRDLQQRRRGDFRKAMTRELEKRAA